MSENPTKFAIVVTGYTHDGVDDADARVIVTEAVRQALRRAKTGDNEIPYSGPYNPAATVKITSIELIGDAFLNHHLVVRPKPETAPVDGEA